MASLPAKHKRLVLQSAAEYYSLGSMNNTASAGESSSAIPTTPRTSIKSALSNIFRDRRLAQRPRPAKDHGNDYIALDNEQSSPEPEDAPAVQQGEAVPPIKPSFRQRKKPNYERALEEVQDDKLLRVLLRNETIATRFQKACTSRLEQYQKGLESTYNDRIADLEKQFREWRGTTQELWLAIEEGTVPTITGHQRALLNWPGPQSMAQHLGQISTPTIIPSRAMAAAAITRRPESHTLTHPPLPVFSNNCVPTSLSFNHAVSRPTKLGTSQCSAAQLSGTTGSQSLGTAQVPLQLSFPVVRKKPQSHGATWVHDTEGYEEDKAKNRLTAGSTRFIHTVGLRDLGPDFLRVLKIPEDRRTVVNLADALGTPSYRNINMIHEVISVITKSDVIINLTYENVTLLGKALCYLKDRRERLWSLAGLPNAPFVDKEILGLCAFFSSQPAAKSLSVKHIVPEGPRALSDIAMSEMEFKSVDWRVLIARPRHVEGQVKGAEYFDVGIERRTARSKTEMAMILPEDAATFSCVAAFLKFSTKHVASISSMMPPMDLYHRDPMSPNIEQAPNEDIVQSAPDDGDGETHAVPPGSSTLFERALKLSSEFHTFTEGTRNQSHQNQEDQRSLSPVSQARWAPSSIGRSGIEQVQDHYEEKPKKQATFFTDDAFDSLCKTLLMGPEIDDDEAGDIIALAGPPPGVSFDTPRGAAALEEDDDDDDDDLMMLDGPPSNVTFSRRAVTYEDQDLPSPTTSPAAKRVKLTLPRESDTSGDQEILFIQRDPENELAVADGDFMATPDTDARNRLTLPMEGAVVAPGQSQVRQAQSEALSRAWMLTEVPGNSASLPSQAPLVYQQEQVLASRPEEQSHAHEHVHRALRARFASLVKSSGSVSSQQSATVVGSFLREVDTEPSIQESETGNDVEMSVEQMPGPVLQPFDGNGSSDAALPAASRTLQEDELQPCAPGSDSGNVPELPIEQLPGPITQPLDGNGLSDEDQIL